MTSASKARPPVVGAAGAVGMLMALLRTVLLATLLMATPRVAANYCGPGACYGSDNGCRASSVSGTHTASNGQSGCHYCLAGRYQSSSVNRHSQCTSCAAGKYSASTGASTCTSCAAGKYASAVGASACYSCPTKEEVPNAARDDCVAPSYCSAAPENASTAAFTHTNLDVDPTKAGVAVRFYLRDNCQNPVPFLPDTAFEVRVGQTGRSITDNDRQEGQRHVLPARRRQLHQVSNAACRHQHVHRLCKTDQASQGLY